MRQSIQQEIQLNARRDRVYKALTDSAQFSSVSGGAPARISPEAGGEFSCFGGMISGRQIELIPGQRIVQAWRAGNWEAGVYSIAQFELSDQGSGTLLRFDHAGFPQGQGEHLEAGWTSNYWEPLKKHFA